VPIQAIPKRVINAFLSAEDKNFYNHHGIDPASIVRAGISDIGRLRANRRPVGASTITQQVAKNMLLTNEISIERKIKEVLLATRIEAALPKNRILELYLNEIYLGAGAYGVAAAAQTYFDKSLDELTLGEGRLSRRAAESTQPLQPGAQPAGSAVPSRLGHRPHGRGWGRDPRGERPRPRGRRSSGATGKRPTRQAHHISPKKSDASCSPAMARRCCMAQACRCARALRSACRRLPTRRCATG